jgi:hypothetical protein
MSTLLASVQDIPLPSPKNSPDVVVISLTTFKSPLTFAPPVKKLATLEAPPTLTTTSPFGVDISTLDVPFIILVGSVVGAVHDKTPAPSVAN